MGGENIYTLDNKVRIVYSHSNDKITALSVFIKVGSINEGLSQHGLSHLLEHMLFKGSRKYPKANKIAWEMDSIGAYFNAYTSKDKTCYLCTAPTTHITHMMDIMSDVVCFPLLTKRDFELERNVVIEELRNSEDEPDSKMDDSMEESVFEGHQLAKSIGGSVEDVKAITYEDMLRYYRDFYCAENIVVSICSDMSFKNIIGVVKKSEFARAREGCDRPNIVRNLNPQNDLRFVYIRKPLEQLYIGIGFRVGSMNGTERFAFDLIQAYLAGPLSSRLFTALREENGIAYRVNCAYNGYIDMSSLVIKTSLDSSKLYINPNGNKKGAISVLTDELNKLVRDGISTEGLKHTKDYLIGSNLVNIESSLGSSDYDGQVVTMGLTPSIFIRDLGSVYNKLEKDTVNRLIKTYIKRENMSIVVISGKDNVEGKKIKREFERLIRF